MGGDYWSQTVSVSAAVIERPLRLPGGPSFSKNRAQNSDKFCRYCVPIWIEKVCFPFLPSTLCFSTFCRFYSLQQQRLVLCANPCRAFKRCSNHKRFWSYRYRWWAECDRKHWKKEYGKRSFIIADILLDWGRFDPGLQPWWHWKRWLEEETSPQSNHIHHLSAARTRASIRKVPLSRCVQPGRAGNESELARSQSPGKHQWSVLWVNSLPTKHKYLLFIT